MTSTASRKTKPLPASLDQALAGMGYRRMSYQRGGVDLYRHPKHADLYFQATVCPTPGYGDWVVCEWRDAKPDLRQIDMVILGLKAQLELLEGALWT